MDHIDGGHSLAAWPRGQQAWPGPRPAVSHLCVACYPSATMLTDEIRTFVDAIPVARLATADRAGVPHVVPICFALIDQTVFVTVDEKPKSEPGRPLKRIRNIIENPQAVVLVDRYDEDWARLGWVMLRGAAEIIDAGVEHDVAQAALVGRYPQYREMELAYLPVIAVRITRVTHWGNLSAAG